MIMENGFIAYYMRSLQQNYVIYITFISIYINEIFKNVEQIHISSQYEIIESDTTLEYAQKLVDEIIENAVEKYITENKEKTVSQEIDVVNKKTLWQKIKSFKPFTFIF